MVAHARENVVGVVGNGAGHAVVLGVRDGRPIVDLCALLLLLVVASRVLEVFLELRAIHLHTQEGVVVDIERGHIGDRDIALLEHGLA